MARRSFEEEKAFLEKLSPNAWKIKKGFVPNMKVSLLSGAVYCAREVVLKLAVCEACMQSPHAPRVWPRHSVDAVDLVSM